MSERSFEHILRRLDSGEQEAAWAEFLEEYSSLIFQVVRHFEPDEDCSSDCFQFICEQLVRDRFRRLRKFNPDGTAAFPTWLRAVVRNLCMDYCRKEFGRLRVFRSVQRLSALDQEVFRSVYERGISVDETFLSLVSRFHDLTPDHVDESIARIDNALTAKQRWLLRARSGAAAEKKRVVSEEHEGAQPEMPDPRPDPEALAILHEERKALNRVLVGLSKRERLLLRLRFEEELTLEQIARLLDLGNAQRADRQIREVVARLRAEMDRAAGRGGKSSEASVKLFGKNSVREKWKKPI